MADLSSYPAWLRDWAKNQGMTDDSETASSTDQSFFPDFNINSRDYRRLSTPFDSEGGMLDGPNGGSNQSWTDLADVLGIDTPADWMSPAQVDAMYGDLAQKAVRTVGGLIPNWFGTVIGAGGLGRGEQNRQDVNNAYSDHLGRISVAGDWNHPDFAYGSPEDVARAAREAQLDSIDFADYARAANLQNKQDYVNHYNQSNNLGGFLGGLFGIPEAAKVTDFNEMLQHNASAEALSSGRIGAASGQAFGRAGFFDDMTQALGQFNSAVNTRRDVTEEMSFGLRPSEQTAIAEGRLSLADLVTLANFKQPAQVQPDFMTELAADLNPMGMFGSIADFFGNAVEAGAGPAGNAGMSLGTQAAVDAARQGKQGYGITNIDQLRTSMIKQANLDADMAARAQAAANAASRDAVAALGIDNSSYSAGGGDDNSADQGGTTSGDVGMGDDMGY